MGYLLHPYGQFITFLLCIFNLTPTYEHKASGFNFGGLVVARVGLGAFEACFGPGIPLYLCKEPISCSTSHGQSLT